MAFTATVTQVEEALMGRPTTFVVACTNGGASAAQINALVPRITTPGGSAASNSCNVSDMTAPAGTSAANTGPYQFNVTVDASGTAYFTFRATFYAPAILGGPAVGKPTWYVTVDGLDSDDAIFTTQQKVVELSQPVFGLSPGVPPNPTVNVGAFQLQAPSNSLLSFVFPL